MFIIPVKRKECEYLLIIPTHFILKTFMSQRHDSYSLKASLLWQDPLKLYHEYCGQKQLESLAKTLDPRQAKPVFPFQQ